MTKPSLIMNYRSAPGPHCSRVWCESKRSRGAKREEKLVSLGMVVLEIIEHLLAQQLLVMHLIVIDRQISLHHNLHSQLMALAVLLLMMNIRVG